MLHIFDLFYCFFMVSFSLYFLYFWEEINIMYADLSP